MGKQNKVIRVISKASTKANGGLNVDLNDQTRRAKAREKKHSKQAYMPIVTNTQENFNDAGQDISKGWNNNVQPTFNKIGNKFKAFGKSIKKGWNKKAKEQRQQFKNIPSDTKNFFSKKNMTIAGKIVGNIGFMAAKMLLRTEPELYWFLEPYLDALQKDMNNGNLKETKHLAKNPETYFQRFIQEVLQTGNPLLDALIERAYQATIHNNPDRITSGIGKDLFAQTLATAMDEYNIPGGTVMSENIANAIWSKDPSQLIKNPDKIVLSALKSTLTGDDEDDANN